MLNRDRNPGHGVKNGGAIEGAKMRASYQEKKNERDARIVRILSPPKSGGGKTGEISVVGSCRRDVRVGRLCEGEREGVGLR